MRDSQELVIRNAVAVDVKALASLSDELGYPTTVPEIQHRLTMFSSSLADQVLVAELDFVVGWINFTKIQSLQSESFAEIRGHVVSKAHRHAGIGTKLVSAAENWAKNHDHTQVRIRTNVKRKQAIKFYKKLGYRTSKTQDMFDKSLSNQQAKRFEAGPAARLQTLRLISSLTLFNKLRSVAYRLSAEPLGDF